jgi:hypothetical protein
MFIAPALADRVAAFPAYTAKYVPPKKRNDDKRRQMLMRQSKSRVTITQEK